ncbi:Kinesin-like protein [Actinidia chinensis var. chinensis]|uniref:Kinesin-like protein n=1 Tax=Actinidia chinensis var. chinensis TaxID=1590841 RepID=A0A2R6PM87_ACTCC|nr:Kinesin-like protein [Actinidia chinensis var. chinensis]
MASSDVKPTPCSNLSQKVRIVARIRGFTDQESKSLNGDSVRWISVHKHKGDDGSSEKVTIAFENQSASHRDVYKMDYCYEQNEDNGLVFSREIKPLISKVFDGQNVTIIAYGARGSGKTYTIQGTEEKPGLAALAIAEVLSMIEGNEKSVAISLYEVIQDHVYDLLDPTHLEVRILEDAQGRIKLKGLSKAFVKSISEFHKLYFNECSSHQAKMPFELPRKSHRGVIVHILYNNGSSTTKLLGKINFVDLSGYEDARRKSFEGLILVESSRFNKSLYALLNVIYAINANETRVPYRESKLTRMLQNSFGGTNHVLMLTCLNPLFCQDSICTTNLASRSCQGANRFFTSSTKKPKASAKRVVLSSLPKGNLGSVSASAKKPTSTRPHFSEKNTSHLIKGRKLYDEGNNLSSSMQAESRSNIASVMQSRFLSDIGAPSVPYLQEEETSISDDVSASLPKSEEKPISDAFSAMLPITEETSLVNAVEDTKPIEEKHVSLYSESNQSEVTSNIDGNMKALTYLEDGYNKEKENKSLPMNEGESPPLSARLRELSNNLKSLYTSTPLHIKIPHETHTPFDSLVVSADIVEPKTPVTEQNLIVNKWEVAHCPSGSFSARRSGFKHSLVQDYLKFLNSASKEELKGLRGIGEKRANYILERREESPEPFKDLDDLKDIGLSAKQIKGMMKKLAGDLFS